MSTEQQALGEMPLWLVIMISLAGLSGELLRASGADMTGGELTKRVALRFGACAVFGLASLMLTLAAGAPVLAAGGIGCVVAVLGADVAGGLYTRWLAKRAGVQVPEHGDGQ